MTSAHTDDTQCVVLPEELLRRCRADESGVQLTDRKKLRPLQIKPEVDALGYDPFEDQPTLIHTASWRASVEPPTDFPLPLDQKKTSWLDSLPVATRAALLIASQPVEADAPRIAGAIAQPRKR